jgi:hypothetical protein
MKAVRDVYQARIASLQGPFAPFCYNSVYDPFALYKGYEYTTHHHGMKRATILANLVQDYHDGKTSFAIDMY